MDERRRYARSERDGYRVQETGRSEGGRFLPKEAGSASGEEVAYVGQASGLLATLLGYFRTPLQKGIAVAVIVLLALVCAFPVAGVASSPETHASSIASLDEKRDQVMQLVGASAALSAGITVLPGDVGTPIAQKLADVSTDFIVVLVAIYLEKYLITILGLAAFRLLIPLACLALVAALLLGRQPYYRQMFANLAGKLALFAVATFLVVPTSVFLSNMIQATYDDNVQATLDAAQETQNVLDNAAQNSSSADSNDNSIWSQAVSAISNTVSNATNSAATLVDQVKTALNNFIEAFAVMMVTSCVIPILVLLFFLWLVRVILGVNVNIPTAALRR